MIRILERFGWRLDRIRGSHHIMRHAERTRIVISVPVHAGKTLPIGMIVDALKDAAISVKDFNSEAK